MKNKNKENYPGYRITELWIFVGIDEDDDEGLMAIIGPNGAAVPLVAADAARRDSLVPIADEIVRNKGGHYEVRHYVPEPLTMFDEIKEDADRQLMIRGLAVQSLTSPGFELACRECAKKLNFEEMYDSLRESMGDLYE